MALKDNLRRRRATERKLKEHRDLLVKSVRLHILPRFVQEGFVVTKGSNSSDIFPLGHLRRTRPDGTVDLAEVQFMTHSRAAFRINACAVPTEGVMTLAGRRAADEIDAAGGLHDHFEMYSSPRWRQWFSLRFWRFRKPTEAGYETLARSVAAMLPEVESALLRGEGGPHMRKITYPTSHDGKDERSTHIQ